MSASHTASKAKLQAKAKDIEESAAYSENFEEESMGQSMAKEASASKDILNKMEIVKEESIDDSQYEQSKDVTQSIGSENRSSKATPVSKGQD